MKKIFFLLAISAFTLVSCESDKNNRDNEAGNDSSPVTNLEQADSANRAETTDTTSHH